MVVEFVSQTGKILIKMDKVSIIIPVYNCEKFLPQTLDSVLNQTYQDWEAIVINDASTDGSLQKALEYEKKDSRIKVYSMNKNSGVATCRNEGIAKSSGRFLAFLDSDDLWAENKLMQQVFFMKKNKAGLSHTSYAFVDENSKPMATGNVVVDFVVDRKKYMKTTQIGLSTVMVDRNLIPDISFPQDRELCEDARAWMNQLRKGEKFYGLNNVLMLYRVRRHQLSRNKIKMAKNTLKRYLNEKDLPLYLRLYYFTRYAINGLNKRLKKTPATVAEFFTIER